MDKKQNDFYLKLRRQIQSWLKKRGGKYHQWVDIILLAPDIFHLLTRLMMDPDVPAGKKAKISGAIAYFILPFDIIPEAFFGPVGYLDDIALAAFVLNDLINNVDAQIVRRNWAGEQDILSVVKTILVNADQMVGKGAFRKLKKYL
ncbi:MAG: DUF1232 domain-containing protein [Calditrichia bacterium]